MTYLTEYWLLNDAGWQPWHWHSPVQDIRQRCHSRSESASRHFCSDGCAVCLLSHLQEVSAASSCVIAAVHKLAFVACSMFSHHVRVQDPRHANLHKWRLAQSPPRDSGHRQTMNHCRHVPINNIWRWTESTTRSGWWRSHMAGIYSDCSTREIIILEWARSMLEPSAYDTRCYINMRSKAHMSQLNLPHATDN